MPVWQGPAATCRTGVGSPATRRGEPDGGVARPELAIRAPAPHKEGAVLAHGGAVTYAGGSGHRRGLTPPQSCCYLCSCDGRCDGPFNRNNILVLLPVCAPGVLYSPKPQRFPLFHAAPVSFASRKI